MPAAPQLRNGLAIAALCCGIIGMIVGLIPYAFFVGVPLAVLAIVFGTVEIGRARRIGGPKGMALAGLLTGIVAAVLSIIGMVIFFSTLHNVYNSLNKLYSDLQASSTSQLQTDLQGVTHQEHVFIRQNVFIGNGP